MGNYAIVDVMIDLAKFITVDFGNGGIRVFEVFSNYTWTTDTDKTKPGHTLRSKSLFGHI